MKVLKTYEYWFYLMTLFNMTSFYTQNLKKETGAFILDHNELKDSQ